MATILNPVPNTLVNNTVADATLVMANFAAIVSGVNAGAAENGTNTSITSLLGLTTPLSAAQGGTQTYSSGTAGGTANALTATQVTPSSGFVLQAGVTVFVTIALTNSGPATLAYAGTAATAININTSSGLSALSGGELVAGQRLAFTYTGTVWVLVTPGSAALTNISNTFTAANSFISSGGNTTTVGNSAATGANGDYIGGTQFTEKNSTGSNKVFASAYGKIVNATAGSEAGEYHIGTAFAGSGAVDKLIVGAGVYTATATGGDKGAGTINVTGAFLNGVQFGSQQFTLTVSGTPTTLDITGLPSWAKKIELSVFKLKGSGTSHFLVQIGNGAIVNTGYEGWSAQQGLSVGSTAGFPWYNSGNTANHYGLMTITAHPGNAYVASGVVNAYNLNQTPGTQGGVTLGGVADRIRVTFVNGTDTFATQGSIVVTCYA